MLLIFDLPHSLIRWWDLRTRKLTTSLTFPGPITSMELSPQTKRLVVTSGKTVAFIPVLPNGTGTHTLTLPYSPSSASIHPVLQDRFVTGNLGDEWVRVHGMDGEERDVLKGHHGPVHCVEFSPDGEMYASGSGESQICLNVCLSVQSLTSDLLMFIRGWWVPFFICFTNGLMFYIFLQEPSDSGKRHRGNRTACGKDRRTAVSLVE